MVALGTGVYTAREAAMLLHEKPETVSRWAFGYRRIRSGGAKDHPPLISTELPTVDGKAAITFVELIELLYIRAFAKAGATWSIIKEAARIAARICIERGDLEAAQHPFASKHLFVDPEGLLYYVLNEVDEAAEGVIQLRGHGQYEIPPLIKPYLEEIEFDVNALAKLWWPLGKDGGVVIDPLRAFGSPVLEGTSLSTQTVARMFAAERDQYRDNAVDRVAWIYEIDARRVHNALDFESWLTPIHQ